MNSKEWIEKNNELIKEMGIQIDDESGPMLPLQVTIKSSSVSSLDEKANALMFQGYLPTPPIALQNFLVQTFWYPDDTTAGSTDLETTD